jgi:acetyl-CoA C-acetyltransferase
MHEFGTTPDHMGHVAVKNHDNSANNPRARFRNPVSLEQTRASRLIADPLRLYDCCPVSDGAAAVVLCPTDRARRYTEKPVEIIGTAQATGYYALYRTPNPVSLEATAIAANKAFEMARIKPGDVDVVELHDCFSIAEIVDSEDLGFFPKGRGGYAAADGETRVGGKIPINPSGGLLSKGHPVRASDA